MDTKAIREALQAATPGPWNSEGREIWHRGASYKSTNDPHRWVCDIVGDEDRHLIANAPTWLQQLLDENERLQKERDHYKASADQGWTATTLSLSREVEQLQADKAVAAETLKWIADAGYGCQQNAARTALERIESGEKGLPDKEKPRT